MQGFSPQNNFTDLQADRADFGDVIIRGSLTVKGVSKLKEAVADTLSVKKNSTLEGDLKVLGDLTVGVDALVVDSLNKTVNLNSSLTIGNANTTAYGLTVYGPTILKGVTEINNLKSLDVNGLARVEDLIVDGNLTVNGNFEFPGHVSFYDANVSRFWELKI